MIKIRSAGIVPVRFVNDRYVFLMLRSFGTFWDFPKGQIESGESPFDAAMRETLEETSLTVNDLSFPWGSVNYTTEPFKRGTKTSTYFLAKTGVSYIELPINEYLGKPEHDAYRWMVYDDARKITNDRIGKVLNWANGVIEK